MAPTSSMLQGLNIVHQPLPPSDISDSQDLLGSPPYSHDLAAQLDLWSNVSFASDEPFITNHDRPSGGLLDGSAYDDSPLKSETDSATSASARSRAAVIDPALTGGSASPTDAPSPSHHNFDLDHFLVGLGVDPFQIPPHFHTLYPSPAAGSGTRALDNGGPALAIDPALSSVSPSAHGPITQRGKPAATTGRSPATTTSAAPTLPPAKKSRISTARKSSTASTPSPSVDDAEEAADSAAASVAGGPDLTTPLTASEDKRRRNTAASARFRLKKKEREQAMDRKAKELETRVGELERECEALRRENGWLKGLVVGVTGGGAPGGAAAISAGMPIDAQATMFTSAAVAAGYKRGRAEMEEDDKNVSGPVNN